MGDANSVSGVDEERMTSKEYLSNARDRLRSRSRSPAEHPALSSTGKAMNNRYRSRTNLQTKSHDGKNIFTRSALNCDSESVSPTSISRKQPEDSGDSNVGPTTLCVSNLPLGITKSAWKSFLENTGVLDYEGVRLVHVVGETLIELDSMEIVMDFVSHDKAVIACKLLSKVRFLGRYLSTILSPGKATSNSVVSSLLPSRHLTVHIPITSSLENRDKVEQMMLKWGGELKEPKDGWFTSSGHKEQISAIFVFESITAAERAKTQYSFEQIDGKKIAICFKDDGDIDITKHKRALGSVLSKVFSKGSPEETQTGHSEISVHISSVSRIAQELCLQITCHTSGLKEIGSLVTFISKLDGSKCEEDGWEVRFHKICGLHATFRFDSLQTMQRVGHLLTRVKLSDGTYKFSFQETVAVDDNDKEPTEANLAELRLVERESLLNATRSRKETSKCQPSIKVRENKDLEPNSVLKGSAPHAAPEVNTSTEHKKKFARDKIAGLRARELNQNCFLRFSGIFFDSPDITEDLFKTKLHKYGVLENAFIIFNKTHKKALVRYPSFREGETAMKALRDLYTINVPKNPPKIVSVEQHGATKTLYIEILCNFYGSQVLIDLYKKIDDLVVGEHNSIMMDAWKDTRKEMVQPGGYYWKGTNFRFRSKEAAAYAMKHLDPMLTPLQMNGPLVKGQVLMTFGSDDAEISQEFQKKRARMQEEKREAAVARDRVREPIENTVRDNWRYYNHK